MSVKRALDEIDQRIKSLEIQLENARQLKTILRDEQLAGDLAVWLSGNGSQNARRQSDQPPTKFQELAAWFKRAGNPWCTMQEMVASGVSHGTLKSIIYKSNSRAFETRKRANEKTNEWRLADPS